MDKNKENNYVSAKLYENDLYLKNRLGIGVSYDIDFRQLLIKNNRLHLYYLNGMCDSKIIQDIIIALLALNSNRVGKEDISKVIENQLAHFQVENKDNLDEIVDQLLSGLLVIFIEGEDNAYIIDTRDYPGRNPEEPDTERVIRGARDGFTENIVENTTLLRRRIRDERLRNEMLQVGERSKTDICISYIKDIADERLIKLIKEKISEIDIDGIPMADKTVEEFIVAQKWNAFPLVRYTERPDIAAQHLFQGHVVVLVDTSPSIIILPTTFLDHMEHAEEYRQSPAVGTLMRLIRFMAMLSSIFLLPLWFLFVKEPHLLPAALSFIGPNEEGNIPIIVQIILAIVGMQFLRMAAIHTPTALATAMGLIAAVLIGDIAVDVGMFSPEVILYVAISTIGSYVTPSYELSVANKFIEMFLLLMTAIFGSIGFIVGFTVSILYLTHIKALETPYLWPFIPFDAKALMQIMFRIPIPYTNVRPTIVNPKNVYSQPVKKKHKISK